MELFRKYEGAYLSVPSVVYNGHYNQEIFVMKFNEKYWYDSEIAGLELISNKPYCPEIVSSDNEKMEIVFKWESATNLNHLIHFKQGLPDDWQDQVKSILSDLEKSDLYKLNLYPHTFYVKDSKVFVMDLYACISADQKILESDISHIINNKDRFEFNDGILDIAQTYKYTIENIVQEWLWNS